MASKLFNNRSYKVDFLWLKKEGERKMSWVQIHFTHILNKLTTNIYPSKNIFNNNKILSY